MNKKLFVGRILELAVERLVEQGAWLEMPGEQLLLPKQELPPSTTVGEPLQVFVYRDQMNQLQATVRLPLAVVGEFAALRVKKILPDGVFFDLGRGFELPVASDEIPFRPRLGERTLVRVELDEDEQLCGSCRINDFLEPARGLQVGQQVALMVWRVTDLGIKMIIDGRCEGLLYADELAKAQTGQRLVGYIARLRDDGKLDLSLNPGGKAGADIGCEKILQLLHGGGFLALHDKSSPEEIRRVLGLSKKQFKRAVGNLYRQKKIELLQTGIRLKS